jgi:hypothetical protein
VNGHQLPGLAGEESSRVGLGDRGQQVAGRRGQSLGQLRDDVDAGAGLPPFEAADEGDAHLGRVRQLLLGTTFKVVRPFRQGSIR